MNLLPWIFPALCLWAALSYFAGLVIARWMRVMGRVNASLENIEQ